MVLGRHVAWRVIVVFVAGLLVRCGAESAPPQVSSISSSSGGSILVGMSASLGIEVSGTDLRFEWSAVRGSISNPTGPSVIYSAPMSPGPDTVSVTVTSGGSSVIRSITFEVIEPSPTPMNTPTPTPAHPPTPMPSPIRPTLEPASPLEDVFPQASDGEEFVFTNQGGNLSAFYEGSEACRHSGLLGLILTYEMKGDGNGGWGVHWINAPKHYFDASSFTALTFWVKGVARNGFQIGIKDANGKEVKVESRELVKVDASEWTLVSVPLHEFADKDRRVNIAAIENVNFGFNQNHGSGKICIDDIAFL